MQNLKGLKEGIKKRSESEHDFASPLLFKRDEKSPEKKKRKLPKKSQETRSKKPKIAATQRLVRLCRNIHDSPTHIGFQFKAASAPHLNFNDIKNKVKHLGDSDKPQGKDFISYPLERSSETDSQGQIIDPVEGLYSKIERRTENFHKLDIQNFNHDDLKLQYIDLFPTDLANHIQFTLEKEVEYYKDDLAKVKICGIWRDIPRKQVAHGDENLTYKFSGNTLPAKPWTDFLIQLKKTVSAVAQYDFNFVLINRYNDGNDRIGWHRDAEPDLDPDAPIASLSFGQTRDFSLKHIDSKDKKQDSKHQKEQSLNMVLEHGSLLIMHPPTNKFWLHSLPPRKKAPNVRINLTFRKILKRS